MTDLTPEEKTAMESCWLKYCDELKIKGFYPNHARSEYGCYEMCFLAAKEFYAPKWVPCGVDGPWPTETTDEGGYWLTTLFGVVEDEWNEFIDDFIETKKTSVIALARKNLPDPFKKGE